MKRFLLTLFSSFTILITGCVSLPDGVEPVSDFDLDSYLGEWYEVARLDHWFERDLQQVTAKYSLRENGSVKVLNRGYSTSSEKWKESEGKAYPVGDEDIGFLKVSFFGPFYGGYCIFELGPNGEYAFVSGSNRSYLWLLSRTPKVSDDVWRKFETRCEELEFDTSELIRVEHKQ